EGRNPPAGPAEVRVRPRPRDPGRVEPARGERPRRTPIDPRHRLARDPLDVTAGRRPLGAPVAVLPAMDDVVRHEVMTDDHAVEPVRAEVPVVDEDEEIDDGH